MVSENPTYSTTAPGDNTEQRFQEIANKYRDN